VKFGDVIARDWSPVVGGMARMLEKYLVFLAVVSDRLPDVGAVFPGFVDIQ
jgi:hypothetical protein